MAHQTQSLAAQGRYRAVLLLRLLSLALDVAVIVYFALHYNMTKPIWSLLQWNNLAFAAAAFGIVTNLSEMVTILASTIPRNRISVCGMIWFDLVSFVLSLSASLALTTEGFFAGNGYWFRDINLETPGALGVFFVELGLLGTISAVHALFSCYLCCGVYRHISERDGKIGTPKTVVRAVPRDDVPLETLHGEQPPPPYSYRQPQEM